MPFWANASGISATAYEITNQWDLGGDGKVFWRFAPDEDWFIRLMRK